MIENLQNLKLESKEQEDKIKKNEISNENLEVPQKIQAILKEKNMDTLKGGISKIEKKFNNDLNHA